ncbi:hypothetical protein SAMN00017405_0175 [Desulfonispora thiosulfatigenes DSM 11270]|uniref:UPF0235 protein SAMN00017405_0175 n=1 Tax=Desulfonispora thiosulfatigenes DSM 11270 TaxID=656914 RepID=A0A1W1VLR1_DESTI|nr:hypothetical protein SAMN00017405_0175 [Desulfonispora thiosulfatigenes DSM 11270]
MSFLTQNEQGVQIKVRLQPRASKNEIKGMQGDSLKLRLTSPPVDGEANNACQLFFSKLCKIPKTNILIISGHKSRNKTILIKNLTKESMTQILQDYI